MSVRPREKKACARLRLEIPNPKHQIPDKFEARMTETQKTSTSQPFWTFRFWILGLVWNRVLGVWSFVLARNET